MKHGALCHNVTPALFWGWGFCYYSTGGDYSVLSVVLGHTRHWILSHMWQHWVWSVLLKTSIHEGQLERLFHWLNSFLHSSAAHMIGSHTFFMVSSLFSQRPKLWQVQANQQMRKVPFCIIVNIPKISYLASLVMQKVNKRILFLFFGLQTLFVQIILSGSHHAQGWKLCLWSSDHMFVSSLVHWCWCMHILQHTQSHLIEFWLSPVVILCSDKMSWMIICKLYFRADVLRGGGKNRIILGGCVIFR
jgi:hypothetical protein